MVGRKRRTTAKGPAPGKKTEPRKVDQVEKKKSRLDDLVLLMRQQKQLDLTPKIPEGQIRDANLEKETDVTDVAREREETIGTRSKTIYKRKLKETATAQEDLRFDVNIDEDTVDKDTVPEVDSTGQKETLLVQEKRVPILRLKLGRAAGGTSWISQSIDNDNPNNHKDQDSEMSNDVAMEVQGHGNIQLSEGWMHVIRKTGGSEYNKDPVLERQRKTAGRPSKKNEDQPSTRRRLRAESSAHTEVSVSDNIDVDREMTNRPEMDTRESSLSLDLGPSSMLDRSPHEQHLADHDEDIQEEDSNRLGMSPSPLPTSSPRLLATEPLEDFAPHLQDSDLLERDVEHASRSSSHHFSSPLTAEDQMLFVNCLRGDAFLQIPQDVSGRSIENAEFCPLCFSSVQSSRQHIVSVHLRKEVDKNAAKGVARYLIHWARKNRVNSSTTMLKSELLNRCRHWEDVSALVELLQQKGIRFYPVDHLRGVIFEGTGLPTWSMEELKRDFGLVAGRRSNLILWNDCLDKKKFTENAWRELTKRELQQELMNVVPVKSLCQNRTEEIYLAAERHLVLEEHPFLLEMSDLVKTTCQTSEEEEEHEANVASFLSVVLNGMRTCERFRLIQSEGDFDLAEMNLGLGWLAEAFKFNGQTERSIDFFRRVSSFASSFARVTDRLIWRSQMIELMQACAPYCEEDEEENGGQQRSPAASGSESAQQQY